MREHVRQLATRLACKHAATLGVRMHGWGWEVALTNDRATVYAIARKGNTIIREVVERDGFCAAMRRMYRKVRRAERSREH